MSLDSFIIPLLTAVVTTVTALFLLRGQRRKLEAEADSLFVGAAGETIKYLQSETARLCQRLAELETDIDTDRTRIQELQAAVSELTKENKGLQATVNRLVVENRDLKVRVATLEVENQKLRAENQKLKGRMDDSDTPRSLLEREPK